MAPSKYTADKAEIFLGKRIETLRRRKGWTQMQLGKMLNQTAKQIAKYEQGGFVSLPTIEALGEAFDQPVQKKIIRRISFLRKLENETDTPQQEELTQMYDEALPEEWE